MIEIEKEKGIKNYEDWILKSLKLVKLEILNDTKDGFD